jgi:anti-sigma B factor antagonist
MSSRIGLLSQTEEERGELMDLTLNEYSAAPGRTVVEVSGEIDVYTAPRLREALIGLVDGGNYWLIIDLEGVEFLDSTGLGVLVGGLKRVRAHDGGIDLVCTQGKLLRIFRITGLSKVFSIYDSVAAALGAPGADTADTDAGDTADTTKQG